MKRLLILFAINLFLVYSCKHSSKSTEVSSNPKIDSAVAELPQFELNMTINTIPKKYFYKEQRYLNSEIIIQNSFPKGGSYIAADGSNYGYGIFVSSISNQLAYPIDIEITFPDDPIDIGDDLDAKFQLFVPKESLSMNDFDLFNYGVEDLSFFEEYSGRHKKLSIRVAPNEKSFFYMAILFDGFDNGPIRTELQMIEKEFYYKVNYGSVLDAVVVPCGEILF